VASERPVGGLEIPAAIAFILLMAITAVMGSGEIRILRMVAVMTGIGSLPLIFLPMYTLKRYGEVDEGESYMATKRVVDRGLFSLIRHPQYLGYILMGVTFALISQRWYSVVLAALGSLFFLLHARQEETFLREKFGLEYADYVARVPGLNLLLGVARALRREQKGPGSG
jgi:protein-S-isoprenylcysteine O-methyltransferase Ste14